MSNIGRVAFVATGGLRTFAECYSTWNIFTGQHNYVFTWDVDYHTTPYGPNPLPTLTKYHDLVKAKERKCIKDYEVFIEPDEFKKRKAFKTLYLWSKLESYLSYDYDYVYISRPDCAFPNSLESEYPRPEDNEIYVDWFSDNTKSVSDIDFFMTRTTLQKFSKLYQWSEYLEPVEPNLFAQHGPHSHLVIYKFLKENGIKLYNMDRYLSAQIFREPLKITPNPMMMDFRNEIFREYTLQNKHDTNKQNSKAILLVSERILSGIERDALTKHLENREGLDNYMFFESYSEEFGMKKISNFSKTYNINFCQIMVIHK